MIQLKSLLAAIVFFLGMVHFSAAQVRFYAQFRSVPFTQAATNNFNLLTGIKLDPNKEVVLGIGMAGSFSPRELKGDLSFNKSNISLSFSYYFSRKFYLNGELNYNLVRGVVTDLVDEDPIVENSRNLLRKFFFDYDINVTYVVFRRLHFSFGTGVADFARLARNVTSDVLSGSFQLNLALSLKVYMFQVKF